MRRWMLLPPTSGCLETTTEDRAGRKVDREGRRGRGSWDVQADCSDKRRHRLVEGTEQVLASEQLLDWRIDLGIQLTQVLQCWNRLV